MCDVSERPRYMFKEHPFISQVNDPLGSFSQVLDNVLHVEYIRSHIHCKFESVGDNEIHKELDLVFNGDLSLKQDSTHLEELNIVNYMFHIDFDNQDSRKMILN